MVKTTRRTLFGARLRDARTNAKLTQKELARRTGITQSTLSELETIAHGSTHTPALAAECGVSPVWLATGDGQMHDGLTHIAAAQRGRYIKPSPTPSIEATVAHLAAMVRAHGPTRRSTLAELLSRFARAPDDADLCSELIALLQPPTGIAGKQHAG